MKSFYRIFILCLLTWLNPAFGQAADTFFVKAGYGKSTPHISSGDLSGAPGAKVDVDSSEGFIFSAGYMIDDHLSTELLLGTPYRHDVYAAGVISAAGKIASVDVAPPTILLQYRFFEPKFAWHPYLGAGVTYASFRNDKGSPTLSALTNPGGAETTVNVKPAWGATLQAGFTYSINERWFTDVSLSKTFIKTTMSLSTGQSLTARLDPLCMNLAIGYRF